MDGNRSARKRRHDDRTDAELLRASSRDAEAFGLFYDRHVDAVQGFFTYRTADRALSTDLTAETFASAFASRRRYRRTTRPATAWLFTIAVRQLNEYHRQQRVSTKYRHRIGMATAVSEPGFEQVDDLDELRLRLPALEAALGELTPASAEAVVLRIGHGWSYIDLADHLGCSPGSARVRVSRALTRLHDELSPHEGMPQ